MLTWVSKGASVIAVLAIPSAYASAQPTLSTVHITGVVTDAQTETAIRRAFVTVEATSRQLSSMFADERGSFSLDVPGDATLTITKAGYAIESVKVPGPGAPRPLEVHVTLKRGAAITGRVVDTLGAPAVGATVIARRVSDATEVRPRTVQTDDLGEFRFGGLAEGEFHATRVTVSEGEARSVTLRLATER